MDDMSSVEFKEESFVPSRQSRPKATRMSMAGWLTKNGLAENEKSAELLLIGILVLLVIATGAILYVGLSPYPFGGEVATPQEQRIIPGPDGISAGIQE